MTYQAIAIAGETGRELGKKFRVRPAGQLAILLPEVRHAAFTDRIHTDRPPGGHRDHRRLVKDAPIDYSLGLMSPKSASRKRGFFGSFVRRST